MCTPGFIASSFDHDQFATAFLESPNTFEIPRFIEGCKDEIIYTIGSKSSDRAIPDGLQDCDGNECLSVKTENYLPLQDIEFYLYLETEKVPKTKFGPYTLIPTC